MSMARDQIIIFLLSLFSDLERCSLFFFVFPCSSSISAIKLFHNFPFFADDVETCI